MPGESMRKKYNANAKRDYWMQRRITEFLKKMMRVFKGNELINKRG